MNKDITIVIPVFKLTKKRFRNFNFILTNYLSKLDTKVVVAEQVRNKKITRVSKLVRSFGVDYVPIKVKRSMFHKSYVLNKIVQTITTKYMWMIDADVFLRYSQIIDKIEDQDVICPYGSVFVLSDEQTQIFIKNKKIIVEKGTKIDAIQKFGPLSFIIKTKLFKENLMNEEFIGYGWEDLDFAYRISKKYDIFKININGLHLYHDISKANQEQERQNSKIFFRTKRGLKFNGLTKRGLKFNGLKNLPDVNNAKTIDIENCKNKSPRIVHIIAPALGSNKRELYNREMLAIESIIREKSHYNNIAVIMVCDNLESQKYRNDFNVIGCTRSSKDIGDPRGLPYLSSLFEEACKYCSDADIVFYTNSDCCLAPGTYSRLANMETCVVEYLRRDVLNKPITLNDVFAFPNKLKETGVDGLAFRKAFLKKNPYFVPDFFVGEPHWDTAICGALRTANISSQNVIDLYHPDHEQIWNPENLSIAGKHNDKIYRNFLDYGVSKINLLSKPKEEIETSIVLVHYGHDDKRVSAAKIAMNRLLYQNILNAEFVFVEIIENKTMFPEIKLRPNWVHMVAKEKEVNKDIFQKEAMMNVGAKQARGKIIIFLDTDIWTDDPNWLSSIKDKIKEDPNKIVHGFSFCQDSINPDTVFVSAGLNVCKNIQSDLHENPGLVIGMSKRILEQNKYLNPYHILGGGDSIILHEYLSKKYNGNWARWQIKNFSKIKNIIRELPVSGSFDYVDCSIVHENHGNVDFNSYAMKHYSLDYFTKEIKELVRMGRNGLLEWVDVNCVERQINKARFDMITEEKAREICNKILKDRENKL